MFNDTPEGTTQFCNECEYIGWHGEGTPTGKHSCGIDFKALDESLDKLLEDDFVEEAKRQFIGMYPVAEWDRENGGHIYTTPTLNIKHRDLLEEWLIDTLQRHEAHVLEKVVGELETRRERILNGSSKHHIDGYYRGQVEAIDDIISLITKK